MRTGRCPKCTATSVRFGRGLAHWYGSSPMGQVRVRTFEGPGSTEVASIVDSYVCTTCGNFEQYLVSSDAIQMIASTWPWVPPST